MTKLRDASSFEDAAIEAIHALTPEGVALVADCGAGAVRKWGDPDADGRPTIHKALVTDVAVFAKTGRAPFFGAYLAQLRHLTRDAKRMVGDLVLETLELSSVVGKFNALVRRAHEVGSEAGAKLGDQEGKELLQTVKRLRHELDDCESSIRTAMKSKRG